jgi:hypothetical protein
MFLAIAGVQSHGNGDPPIAVVSLQTSRIIEMELNGILGRQASLVERKGT